MEDLIARITENYNWAGALLSFVGIIVVTKLGKYVLFKIPALAEARTANRAEDKTKLAKDKYPPTVKANQQVGLYLNLTFFLAILPFCVTTQAQPWWQVIRDVVMVLVIYDFFYYLMHRFLFHGQGRLRQVHAIHHQARSPTYIDAHYVHPFETFLGLSLFFIVIVGWTLAAGQLHVISVALMYVAYVQLNQLNHVKMELPYFPFRLATGITRTHHKHHINMQMGNYASIVPLYDKLFGTYE